MLKKGETDSETANQPKPSGLHCKNSPSILRSFISISALFFMFRPPFTSPPAREREMGKYVKLPIDARRTHPHRIHKGIQKKMPYKHTRYTVLRRSRKRIAFSVRNIFIRSDEKFRQLNALNTGGDIYEPCFFLRYLYRDRIGIFFEYFFFDK